MSPRAKTAAVFFGGEGRAARPPGTWALMSSLVISWLFAKSITNAANLGLDYGLIGGVAYAAYYLSFAVAGVVIYRMRTRGGFTSIHQFLSGRYGRGAVILFSLLICFRLFNEVWSNTMVIGSYFGEAGSAPYYWSILVFTGLTLAYSLKGGMSSSILTDIIQMVLFGVLLFVILGAILPRVDYQLEPILTSGNWGAGAGANLLLVAVLQSFSYPFHDPVLTDRGFLSDPATTLRAFLWAVPLGFVCILLFSVVGIYGGIAGVEGQAPVEVARLLGGPLLLVMNFIMVTSAASTLDSTFSSFSKLVVVDLRTSPLMATPSVPSPPERGNVGVTRSSFPSESGDAGVTPPSAAERGNVGVSPSSPGESRDAGVNRSHLPEESSDVGVSPPSPGESRDAGVTRSYLPEESSDVGVSPPSPGERGRFARGEPGVRYGRLAMIALVLLGTIPVFLDPAILSATTVSGAMVVGLAPVFCLWATKAPQLSFHLSVLGGICFGVIYVLGYWPSVLTFTGGKYADLLGVTVYSLVACFGLFLLPYWLMPKQQNL